MEQDIRDAGVLLSHFQLEVHHSRPRMSPGMYRCQYQFICIIAMLSALLPACFAQANLAADKPNILIILADDLGYSDLGCFGGEIRTPELDALANGGLRFTQFYNSSRCCPSRASLLTGLYPHQAGIGRFVGKGKAPGYLGRLADRSVTLAEVLKPAGYLSFASGKWHVNEPGPINRGFDRFYGFVHGYAIDSWDPKMMIALPDREQARTYNKDQFYATDAITDHALDFIEIARTENKPWLMYVSYQAPHFPIQAPLELTQTYVETYRNGWDVIRAERLAVMKELGLMPDALELPPRSRIDNLNVAKRIGSMTKDGNNPAWETLSKERQEDLAYRMAVYAAMVEQMDTNIGRLVASLRESGELENTLIVFTSDNGACAEWEPYGFDLDANAYRNNEPGKGINSYTPGMPNILHTGEMLEGMGGPDASLFSYGSGWANASNTPLSLYKHFAHEGGIRSPMIAHWPKQIKDKGALRSQVCHIMDVMATCMAVSGARYPKHHNGHAILPLEGQSLLPAFDGVKQPPRTLVYEHERNIAIRVGDYKLLANKGIDAKGLRDQADWQLYNLKTDPVELHNLADQQPERVTDMLKQLESEITRTLILPLR